MMIRLFCSLGLLLCSTTIAHSQSFEAHISSLKALAQEAGIKESTFRKATQGLRPDTSIYKIIRTQPEQVNPIGSYIENRVRGQILKSGRRKIRQIPNTVRAISKTYGVDPNVVVAIWGLESGYGRDIGNKNVFRSTATLGWKKYRGNFFNGQFISALMLMQEEDLVASKMVGSWAGAMGQTQFIASTYMSDAVDFNKDGKRDLWKHIGDALASTANFLAKRGWIRGQPWGMPVLLPDGFSRNVTTKSWSDWAALGVKSYDNKRFPSEGEATLFMPTGMEGPTFLITPNYEIIREYNSSDSYSLSVGLLAQRLANRPAFKTNWPKKPTLKNNQRVEIQNYLKKLGYEVPNLSGRIIKGVRLAIRDYQLQKGLVADGYPDQELLRYMRRNR